MFATVRSYTKTLLQLISLYIYSLVFYTRSTGALCEWLRLTVNFYIESKNKGYFSWKVVIGTELLGNLDDYLSIGGSRYFCSKALCSVTAAVLN